MLDEVELDAVYIYADNATGADLAGDGGERGRACDGGEADGVHAGGRSGDAAVTRAAGRLLMVNWPFTWWPGLQKAFAMVQAGEIGQVFSTRHRSLGARPKELGLHAVLL